MTKRSDELKPGDKVIGMGTVKTVRPAIMVTYEGRTDPEYYNPAYKWNLEPSKVLPADAAGKSVKHPTTAAILGVVAVVPARRAHILVGWVGAKQTWWRVRSQTPLEVVEND